MSKKKVEDALFQLSEYQVLLDSLRQQVNMKQERIVELIRENDRLTLTYEPWRPESDPNYGVQFHDLVDDNDALTEQIAGLIRENDRLTLTYEPEDNPNHGITFYELVADNDALTEQIAEFMTIFSKQDDRIWNLEAQLRDTKKTVKKERRKINASISFDLYPLTDWFRLSYNKWNPGRYAQLCIGPIRVDIFEG